jgi:broad specificity phosphatase PhoE
MAPIWLVRHAATPWTGVRWCGRSDPELTPAGMADATRLGETLSAALPAGAVVVSSPATRAIATARAIASARMATGTPVVVDPDLSEIDFGEVDGLTFVALEEHYPILARRLLAGETAIDWPGGESADQVRRRAARAWATLVATPSPTVVVTHGGLIATILRQLVGVDETTVIHPAPATALRLDAIAGSWRVAA